VSSGCAVVWDSDGRRHAIGLGYISWPVVSSDGGVSVSGVDILGAAALWTSNSVGVVLGYTSERAVKLNGDAFLMLDCLKCDLAHATVSGGSLAEGQE
jgi:hypothetical protein